MREGWRKKPKAYRIISISALTITGINFLCAIEWVISTNYYPYETPPQVIQNILTILSSMSFPLGSFLDAFWVNPFILLLVIVATIFAAREAGRFCVKNIVWVKWILILAFCFILCAFPATLNVFWFLAINASILKPLWLYGYIVPIAGIVLAIILIIIAKVSEIKILKFQILPLSILILVAITSCLYFRAIFFQIDW